MPRTLFKDYGNRETQRPQEEVKQIMRDVTYCYLEEMERDSIFFRDNPLRAIAYLEPHELEVNKRIGMGEFGVVLEVTSIHLQDLSTLQGGQNEIQTPEASKPLHHLHSKSCGDIPLFDWETEASAAPLFEVAPENELLRQKLASKVLRECDSDVAHGRPRRRATVPDTALTPRTFLRPRFAVKQIRKDLYPKKKIEAGKDLAREAKLLSRLEHPNVIRLRATVGQPGEEDFMLLLDRLGLTLSEQVTQWQQQVNGTPSGIVFPWNTTASAHRKRLQRTVLSERLLALYDVARAMQYLHQKSILFRDLKTENVARNHHGAFQLLDFGLAKELKERDRVVGTVGMETMTEDGSVTADTISPAPSIADDFEDTYKLTGLTGTVRIMSPEVLQCQPYGLSADVYSYGIVLWEVFQGERNHLSAPEVIKGQRPELPVVGMPPRIESLIKKCYGAPAFRPTFAMLSQELEYQLLELQQQEWRTEAAAHVGHHREGGDETFQHICMDHHASIFHRFDYLRQLSVQSLATTTNYDRCGSGGELVQ